MIEILDLAWDSDNIFRLTHYQEGRSTSSYPINMTDALPVTE